MLPINRSPIICEQPLKPSVSNEIHSNICLALDTMTDESRNENDNNDKTQKTGCLTNIIIAMVIIFVCGYIFSECGTTEESGGASVDISAEVTTSALHYASSELMSEQIVQKAKQNIALLISDVPIDTDTLKMEFDTLLKMYLSEYAFKCMANGYFTGDYEPTSCDTLFKRYQDTINEMNRYFSDEEVYEEVTYVGVFAYNVFDDEMFNYERYLVGSRDNPDLDTMWVNFIEEAIKNYALMR